jgi:hypothetical protein
MRADREPLLASHRDANPARGDSDKSHYCVPSREGVFLTCFKRLDGEEDVTYIACDKLRWSGGGEGL